MSKNDRDLIIKLLEVNPYLSQQEIADKLGISRPLVASIISDSIKEGVIAGRAYILNKTAPILTFGGIAFDVKMRVDHQLIAETSNPVVVSTTSGGVIRNVSQNLSQLQEKVELISVVGDDDIGRLLIEKNHDYFDVSGIQIIENASTALYQAVVDQDGDLLYGFAGMDIFEQFTPAVIDRHLRRIKYAKAIVADMNLPKATLSHLQTICAKEKRRLIVIGVSVAKIARFDPFVAPIDLLIVNQLEAQTLLKTKATGIKLIRQMKTLPIKNVVVTNGAFYTYYLNDGLIGKMKPLKASKIVDVTGAGDAYSAGLIMSLLKTDNFEQALKIANCCAILTLASSSSVSDDLSIATLETLWQQNYHEPFPL